VTQKLYLSNLLAKSDMHKQQHSLFLLNLEVCVCHQHWSVFITLALSFYCGSFLFYLNVQGITSMWVVKVNGEVSIPLLLW